MNKLPRRLVLGSVLAGSVGFVLGLVSQFLANFDNGLNGPGWAHSHPPVSELRSAFFGAIVGGGLWIIPALLVEAYRRRHPEKSAPPTARDRD
jgi:hypothetical protein